MTYNVSSGTLNTNQPTCTAQPNLQLKENAAVFIIITMRYHLVCSLYCYAIVIISFSICYCVIYLTFLQLLLLTIAVIAKQASTIELLTCQNLLY